MTDTSMEGFDRKLPGKRTKRKERSGLGDKIQHSYGAYEEEIGEAGGGDESDNETLVLQAKAVMDNLQGKDGNIHK